MSYAQRHRTRLELHQGDLSHLSASANTPPFNGAGEAAVVDEAHHHASLPPQSSHGAAPQRRPSSLLRANAAAAARLQQGHAAGIDIAAWSDAASNPVGGEREPFHLLQHTPPKNDPPRLKASRKQFASPHNSTMATADNAPAQVTLPIVVSLDSPDAASKPGATVDSLATDLRSSQQPAAAAAPQPAPSVGEMSPSPIPVSHQPSQPQPPADSSAASSARASTSQWPASETFAARLRNIMDTRQQIEALVQKQREDEAEMVQAIASLDEQQQQHLPSPIPGSADTVSREVYSQVLMERDAAFAALREFKEKGNGIVHRLYDTVKSQQEQALELIATVEALRRANKRLKESVGNGNSGGVARAAVPADVASATTAELQQRVATQRRVIEQMDQLMQNADRMLLAMRARVEAAERRAAVATAAQAAPLDRRQLPPLPTSGTRTQAGGDGAVAVTAAAVSTPDAVAAVERLAERYPADRDVATVAAQQQLLLDRIAQLRESLKREEAQRLHLEEVYGATSEETARSVALLEERLQRAKNPRMGAHGGSSNNNVTTTSGASALRRELHTLLEEEERKDDESHGADDAADPRPPTPSHASSPAPSSSSSTPTRTLFTAISVGDVNSTTAANEYTDGPVEQKARGKVTVLQESPNTTRLERAPVVEAAAPAAAVPPPVAQPEGAASPPPRQQSHHSDNRDKSGGSGKVDEDTGSKPRAFLSRHRRGADGGDAAATQAVKAPLVIPVPEPGSLGNSLRRSFNSRSSSASRRLVDFRPATALDATSRGLESGSDGEGDSESDTNVAPPPATAGGRQDGGGGSRAAGFTGVTATVTPTAIHSASSPLPDTSTSAEMSAKRQQRLQQQMEELEKLEADVSDVVRSLDVA